MCECQHSWTDRASYRAPRYRFYLHSKFPNRVECRQRERTAQRRQRDCRRFMFCVIKCGGDVKRMAGCPQSLLGRSGVEGRVWMSVGNRLSQVLICLLLWNNASAVVPIRVSSNVFRPNSLWDSLSPSECKDLSYTWQSPSVHMWCPPHEYKQRQRKHYYSRAHKLWGIVYRTLWFHISWDDFFLTNCKWYTRRLCIFDVMIIWRMKWNCIKLNIMHAWCM